MTIAKNSLDKVIKFNLLNIKELETMIVFYCRQENYKNKYCIEITTT